MLIRIARDDADKGQFAEGIGDVHAVTDHEMVRAIEADIVGLQFDAALHALVEQYGDGDVARAAFVEQVLV